MRPPLGLLWRPELARLVGEEAAAGRLGFVEVIAESLGPEPPPGLAALPQAGVSVIPHGVALGLGGAGRPDRRRLARLAAAAEALGAPLVSEHIAFVRAGGAEAGHLLPVPRTWAALDVLVANVAEAEAALPVPLALEPIATLVEWPGAELTEVAFLSELLERTGVRLVLDVANLHVNAANRRRAGVTGPDADARALIRALPLDRVAYVHAAGGRERDGRLHDTHTDPLWPEVDALVEELWARHEIPGVLLERDGAFPPDAELRAELARLAAATERGRARRPPSVPERLPERPHARRPPEERAGLGAAQATLLRSLSGDGPAPPGFPPADVAAVATVLARKRAHAVAHSLPDVAATAGFDERFAAWARRHPQRATHPVSDAGRYLRALDRRDRTVHACRALVALELDADTRGQGRVRLRVCRGAGTTVVGWRVGPFLTVRTLGHGARRV